MNMDKRTLGILSVIILVSLILIAMVWYMATHPAPAPVPPAVTQPVTEEPQSEEIVENSQYFEITAEYPVSVQLPLASNSAAGANVEAVVKAWTTNTIASFKKENGPETLSPEHAAAMGLGTDRKFALGMEYDTYFSPRTISYVYTIFMDTFGAHPNSFFRTFTFDVTTGRELALSEVFVPGSDYLGALSTKARLKLPGIIGTEYADAEYIASGTMPEATMFQNFYLDGDVLTILFPAYQVGPYVLGAQRLPIPLAEFGDMVRPEFRR